MSYKTMLRNISKPIPMCVRHISLSQEKKKVYEITSSIEFNNKVMNGKGTVIVNFHADWCNPCTQLTSKLIELIEPMETLDLAIVNLETNPDLADVFSVKAVPAVFAMSNGLILDKFIGFQGVGMIEKFVEKIVASDPTNSKDVNDSLNSEIEDNSVNLKMKNDPICPKNNGTKS